MAISTNEIRDRLQNMNLEPTRETVDRLIDMLLDVSRLIDNLDNRIKQIESAKRDS